jgi:hypothetical protein
VWPLAGRCPPKPFSFFSESSTKFLVEIDSPAGRWDFPAVCAEIRGGRSQTGSVFTDRVCVHVELQPVILPRGYACSSPHLNLCNLAVKGWRRRLCTGLLMQHLFRGLGCKWAWRRHSGAALRRSPPPHLHSPPGGVGNAALRLRGLHEGAAQRRGQSRATPAPARPRSPLRRRSPRQASGGAALCSSPPPRCCGEHGACAACTRVQAQRRGQSRATPPPARPRFPPGRLDSRGEGRWRGRADPSGAGPSDWGAQHARSMHVDQERRKRKT